MKQTIFFLLAISIIFSSCKQKPADEIREDFKKYYEEYKVNGIFALYNQNEDKYTLYNSNEFKTPYIPASTFKICNSMIGLETGVIPDENYVIKWDSVTRNPVWDKDHDLKTAFKNSTVWYYQELARRVGYQKMKMWLDSAHYGNADTTGGIDRFWLTGNLRISAEQQIDFLKRLHDDQLPFSKRTTDIVKSIMIQKDTLGYVLRAKSGWGAQGEEDIGWYVGYVKTKDNVYYFSNCVKVKSNELNNNEPAILFDHSRKEITLQILKELSIIQ